MAYTVHGILQARLLEWVDFPFSRGSSKPRDWTQVSHIAVLYQLSHKWLWQNLNPGLSDLKAQLPSLISYYLSSSDLRDIHLSIPHPWCPYWGNSIQRRVVTCSRLYSYNCTQSREMWFLWRRRWLLYIHSIPATRWLCPRAQEEGRIPITQAQQMALLAPVHWGIGLPREQCIVHHAGPASLCLRMCRTTHQNEHLCKWSHNSFRPAVPP